MFSGSILLLSSRCSLIKFGELVYPSNTLSIWFISMCISVGYFVGKFLYLSIILIIFSLVGLVGLVVGMIIIFLRVYLFYRGIRIRLENLS